MKYYIPKNGQPDGPYEKDQLLDHGLKKDSFVWCEGMKEWKHAAELDELKDLFPVLPPPLPVDAVMPPIPTEAKIPPTPPTPPPTPQPTPPAPIDVYAEQIGYAPAPQHTPAPSAAQIVVTPKAKWYAKINGTTTELRTKCQLLRDGLTPKTLVYADGMADWVEAINVPELNAIMVNIPMPGTEACHQKHLVSILANGGFNVTNGWLHIFEDYICLVPSISMSVLVANFSKSGYIRQFYAFDELARLKSVFMARKSIIMTDGSKVTLNASKKVYKALVEAHTRYYTSRGLPVPPFG